MIRCYQMYYRLLGHQQRGLEGGIILPELTPKGQNENFDNKSPTIKCTNSNIKQLLNIWCKNWAKGVFSARKRTFWDPVISQKWCLSPKVGR